MIRLVLLVAVVFCLTEATSPIYGYRGYGRGPSHNGDESDVNRANAERQVHVNHIAQHVGSGTGTANWDGVPGTPLGVTGRDRYSDGYYGYHYGYPRGYPNGYPYRDEYSYNGVYGRYYGNY